jgi:predicted glycogen debranching enzyme
MLANTSDVGGTEYNTADGTLWFLHAVGRHVERTGDLDFAASLESDLTAVIDAHVAGTRYGIHVDPGDGLLAEGADGMALTWMDARVEGRAITPRMGKPVEVNALWINGLATVALLQERLGLDSSRVRSLETMARRSFSGRFVPAPDGSLPDVIDASEAAGGPSHELRPNQLLAVSLPFAPLRDAGVVRSCAPLVTPLGLRSLDSNDARYAGRHRGAPAERDRAYHQGTVWPWLIGPYVEASLRSGAHEQDVGASALDGALAGLVAHLGEWGLGSVSETADGDPPHDATGCPFQAWSLAELLRARRMLTRGVSAPAADG